MTDQKPMLSDEDRQVLKSLADNGESAPSQVRHTLLYFSPINDQAPEADREHAAAKAAELSIRAGWRIAARDADRLIIETEQDVEPDTIAARSLWANAMAEETGLTYDGWECMLLAEED